MRGAVQGGLAEGHLEDGGDVLSEGAGEPCEGNSGEEEGDGGGGQCERWREGEWAEQEEVGEGEGDDKMQARLEIGNGASIYHTI